MGHRSPPPKCRKRGRSSKEGPARSFEPVDRPVRPEARVKSSAWQQGMATSHQVGDRHANSNWFYLRSPVTGRVSKTHACLALNFVPSFLDFEISPPGGVGRRGVLEERRETAAPARSRRLPRPLHRTQRQSCRSAYCGRNGASCSMLVSKQIVYRHTGTAVCCMMCVWPKSKATERRVQGRFT